MKKYLLLLLLPSLCTAGEGPFRPQRRTILQEDPYACANFCARYNVDVPGTALGLGIRGVLPVPSDASLAFYAYFDLFPHSTFEQQFIATAINSYTFPTTLPYTVRTSATSFEGGFGVRKYIADVDADQFLIPYVQGGLALGDMILNSKLEGDYNSDYNYANYNRSSDRGGFVAQGAVGVDKDVSYFTLFGEIGANFPVVSIGTGGQKGLPISVTFTIGMKLKPND